MKNITFLSLILIFTSPLVSQCDNWMDKPNKDQLEDYHVIYQQSLEFGDYNDAFNNWKKVFAEAPAADGKRDIQYFEGIKIYNHRFQNAASDAEKEEAKAAALAIYDQLVECYTSGALSCGQGDCLNNKLGYIYGRKAFDMFYTYNAYYSETLKAIEKAIEYGGVNNEYIIFAPAAAIVEYNINNETMDKVTAVNLYNKLNEIADYNINNNESLSDYYLQAKENMNGTFARVEDKIFDCDYFKDKVRDDIESDPDDKEVLKRSIVILKQKNCAPDDPYLVELEAIWSKYAAEYNAKVQAEFEANNPSVVAKKLYDEGKFREAIEKYDEAISAETDKEKKASYLFSQASILFRKLSSYSEARSVAYEAAKLKPNWGRPYMFIGDMYAKSSRSCGDAWNQRLAILAAVDKYTYARSIDASVSDEVNERVSRYSRSYPDQETGFLKGVKEGDTEKVGCWIGETVRIRYSK